MLSAHLHDVQEHPGPEYVLFHVAAAVATHAVPHEVDVETEHLPTIRLQLQQPNGRNDAGNWDFLFVWLQDLKLSATSTTVSTCAPRSGVLCAEYGVECVKGKKIYSVSLLFAVMSKTQICPGYRVRHK